MRRALARPMLSSALKRVTCQHLPLRAVAAATARRRWIGESSGLQALADKGRRRSTPMTGDTLGLSSGETLVDSYASWGFTVNGVALVGPVLLLPRASLLFQAPRLGDVTPESLALLTLLEQPPKMLVLGCGRQSRRAPASVRAWCEEQGIAIEALPTQHACATFNFMVSENRPVAAVLFPLEVDDDNKPAPSKVDAPAPVGSITS